jgi:hypothetical protein
MNVAQRLILIVGFFAILGMTLFPPWTYLYNPPRLDRMERPAGYHFIFSDHTPRDQQRLIEIFNLGPNNEYNWALQGLRFFTIRIDTTRLTVQVTATLILITILYLAFRSRST